MLVRVDGSDAFVRAAARLATRVALLADRVDDTTEHTQDALLRARDAAASLEQEARLGADLADAYLRAAEAMNAAADAIESQRIPARPWVHVIPAQKNPRLRGV